MTLDPRDGEPGRPVDENVQIGARVRGCIAASGYTQRAFAEEIGLEATKLSKSLAGRRRFSPSELVAVAGVSGVTVHWLLTGTEDPEGESAVPAPPPMHDRIRESPRKQRRRRVVLSAAWTMIAERGYCTAGIAEIAEAAGVSPSTIVDYFGSKRDLLDECLRASVKEAYDRQTAELENCSDPLTALEHLLVVQSPGASPQVAREWSFWVQVWAVASVDERSRIGHAEAYARWHATIENALANAKDAGLIVDRPLEEMVGELTALFDGLGLQLLMGTIDAATMRQRIRAYLHRSIVRGSFEDP